MSKKNILLTGASGTVGFEVLKQLQENKLYNVTVFDKESKISIKKLSPLKNQIKIIYGDISIPEDVKKIPNNQHVVIHLAAIIPPVADDFPALAQKINVGGTQNLIQHLEQTSPNCFFMYSSSISVYGDRVQNPLISINDPLIPSPGDEYALTKIQAEELLKSSHLDYTIFRLAAIMGGHKMSKLMFHQPLNTSLEIATPRDTARAFVNGIEKQNQLSKRTFNLGGGEKCRTSYSDFLQKSFTVFGLGALDFPEKAFAEKNFHCGFYADADDLQNIVDFQRDSLKDYFEMEAQKVSALKKIGASIFKRQVKHYLLKQSEPLQALKNRNNQLINHYYNS